MAMNGRQVNGKTKESLVKIVFKEAVYLDKISFDIDYHTFYLRNAELCLKDSILKNNRKKEVVYNSFSSFNLNCNSSNVVFLNKLYAKEIYLKIKIKEKLKR